MSDTTAWLLLSFAIMVVAVLATLREKLERLKERLERLEARDAAKGISLAESAPAGFSEARGHRNGG